MKKLSTKHKVALVEIVIVVALALWLFLPKSFERAMNYDFDPAQVTEVEATLAPRETGEALTIVIDPKTEAYDQLMDLLESKRYMAQGDGGQDRGLTLDYGVVIEFRQGMDRFELAFTGAEQMDFTGGGDDVRAYRTSGSQAFQQEVLTFLLAQPLV
ncbi:MAG: hypothetical protein HUJ67_07000 [Ruminiclostridium sp.]|nr:hypothetical protein [Ruminiclostridium sp.]